MNTNNMLKVLKFLVEMIIDYPIKTAMIIFLTTLFIALSSLISGVWQIAFLGFYTLIVVGVLCIEEY